MNAAARGAEDGIKKHTMLSTMVAGGLLLAGAMTEGSQQAGDHQAHQVAGHASVDPVQYSPELFAQLEAVRAATERFRDHDVALAEGYELVGGDGPLMGEHWVRRDMTDRPFDMYKPSTLQYLKIEDEYVLTGVAYTVYRGTDEPLPDGFAGDADVWHLHDMMKISMTATEDRPLLRWITERRIAHGRTRWDQERPELTMVHAWTWLNNPDGVFAQEHRLIPYVRLGLPEAWGTGASADAAYGVALLGDEACGLEVRKTNFIAGTGWRQRRALTIACSDAEAAVYDALSDVDPSDETEAAGEALNAVAQEAWQGYVERRAEILTAEQLARLAVDLTP